jgi:putative acetyltransferase
MYPLPIPFIPEYFLRPIVKDDNLQVAELVQSVLEEFGIEGEGCAASDADLFILNHYRDKTPRCQFYVVVHAEKPTEVLGSIGYEPLKGDDSGEFAEVVKFYLKKPLRGLGIGQYLLEHVLEDLKRLGYQEAYMETSDRLLSAPLFKKFGFQHLTSKKGNNGHEHPLLNIFMSKLL